MKKINHRHNFFLQVRLTLRLRHNLRPTNTEHHPSKTVTMKFLATGLAKAPEQSPSVSVTLMSGSGNSSPNLAIRGSSPPHTKLTFSTGDTSSSPPNSNSPSSPSLLPQNGPASIGSFRIADRHMTAPAMEESQTPTGTSKLPYFLGTDREDTFERGAFH
jgi:hypothetical protein